MRKKQKILRPCLCLCGRLTSGLYFPGCDQIVRIALARDMANGNLDAARVLQTLADTTVSNEVKRRIYADC
jgi:hypothetical protein